METTELSKCGTYDNTRWWSVFLQAVLALEITSVTLLLHQERVWDDVAVTTSFCQVDRSWGCRFTVASPRFIGCRSAFTVLSQDCLGQPILHLQLTGGPEMQAWRARWWSCLGSAQWRCSDDKWRLRTVWLPSAGAYLVVSDKFWPYILLYWFSDHYCIEAC